MGVTNNLELVEYAKAQLGRPYWFGTVGDIASAKLWECKAKMHPEYYSHIRKVAMQNRGDIGKKVHDCSGLIKGALWSVNADTASTYKAIQDLSANGFFQNAPQKGTIDTIPEIVGLAVWRNNHIGIYIGGGEVIEAMGFDYGVVKTKLSERNFTHWLKICFIDYVEATEKPTVVIPTKNDAYYTVVKGDILSKIAKKFNTTVDTLVILNRISNPDRIYIGEKILLPSDTTKQDDVGIIHIVTRGQTLTSIAKKYNTTVSALVKLNNIPNPDRIYVGQRLKIR